MSEITLPKVHRTKEVISREFSSLCTKAGHAAYQVATIQKDLELMQQAMRDLNLEAAASAKAEADLAKSVEQSKESPNA